MKRSVAFPVLVVALGGNAITRAGDEPSVTAQFERARHTCRHLVPVIASGRWRVVITHGNGPQVGNILVRSDLAAEAGVLPRLPLDTCVSDTQGGMGYMIQQCLRNALAAASVDVAVATVVTQVVVDADDPAFADPSKPVGRFYPEEQVEELRRHGWTLKPDSGGRGWRRVVASPTPKRIVEEDVIAALVRSGVVTIACGGGGIPVVAGARPALRGVEAVIDKDLASSLLATRIGAASLAILTEVDRVYVNFGMASQRGLDTVDVATLEVFARQGHFPRGSMAPKIEAVTRFVQRGGTEAIITSPELLGEALAGRAGTRITAAGRAAAAGA